MSALLLLLPAFAGEPWDFAGASVRDVSMGGAGAAGSEPGEALPIDPGAVASVSGEMLSMSWRHTSPDVRLGETVLLEEPVGAMDLAVALGGAVGQARLGAGLALYLPLPVAVDTTIHVDVSDPQAPMLEDAWDFASFDMAFGGGVGPIEISVGAAVGMDLVANTQAVVQTIAGAEATDDGLELEEGIDITLDRELVWQGAPLVGAHLRLDPLDAYVSWRGAIGMESTGNNDLVFEFDLLGLTFDPVNLELDYLSAWAPARLAGGVAWDFGWLRPEVAVRHLWTSAFLDSQRRVPDPVFRNVVELAGGVEAVLPYGIAVRAGYGRKPSPVPKQQGEALLADSTRHLIGGGLAWTGDGVPREGDATELHLGYQHQIVTARRVGGMRFSGRIWTLTTGFSAAF